MTKLKLGPLIEDKPVKVTVELPGPLHRDLAAYAEVLARNRAVRVAVNQVMGREDTALQDGAEVAFFPPVTGG